MKLNREMLLKVKACKEGIDFCERNKLFGFPLDRLGEVQGDYINFVKWLKDRTFDSNNNLIRVDKSTGFWETYQYDENGNRIRVDSCNGDWIKYQYDQNNNEIRYDYSSGYWVTTQYDQNGNQTRIDYSDGDWSKYQYDQNNNLIRIDDSDGGWEIYESEYYDNGQLKRYGDLIIPYFEPIA